jgi:hypothetical protein
MAMMFFCSIDELSKVLKSNFHPIIFFVDSLS